MTPKYSIGDHVWRATWETEKIYLACPDCGGTLTLTVTLFDGTHYAIACATCSPGFSGPTGRVPSFKRLPNAKPAIITGIELRADKVEYRCAADCVSDDGRSFTASYILESENVFGTEAEATTRALRLAEIGEMDELARLKRKEKPARDWAWHITYHRQCIKRAEREIEQHTARLNFARAKAKAPVEAA